MSYLMNPDHAGAIITIHQRELAADYDARRPGASALKDLVRLSAVRVSSIASAVGAAVHLLAAALRPRSAPSR